MENKYHIYNFLELDGLDGEVDPESYFEELHRAVRERVDDENLDWLDYEIVQQMDRGNIFGYEDTIVQREFDRQDFIEEAIEGAIQKAQDVLPSSGPVSVYLLPTYQPFIEETLNGVSGYTPDTHVIHVFVHPDATDNNDLKEEIFYTVVHEYNHAVRNEERHAADYDSVLGGLIFEGLAESFAGEVMGYDLPPIIKDTGIDDEQARELLREIEDDLDSEEPEAWFRLVYGDEDDSIPMWAAYGLGYRIVQAYMETLDEIDWRALTHADPQVVFEESRFL